MGLLAYDRAIGSISISSSSPGSTRTPEFKRQAAINGLLGGRVAAVYVCGTEDSDTSIRAFAAEGIEPHNVPISDAKFKELLKEVNGKTLWDSRTQACRESSILLVAPSGFIGCNEFVCIPDLLPPISVELDFFNKTDPVVKP